MVSRVAARALVSEMRRLGFAQQVRQVSEGPCAGPGTPRRTKEGVHVQERRDLISQGEVQNLCDLHDEGIFMAQSGPWHKMEKKLADIHNGDRSIIASREREFGGHRRVLHNIRIFGGDQRSGSKVQVDVG